MPTCGSLASLATCASAAAFFSEDASKPPAGGITQSRCGCSIKMKGESMPLVAMCVRESKGAAVTSYVFGFSLRRKSLYAREPSNSHGFVEPNRRKVCSSPDKSMTVDGGFFLSVPKSRNKKSEPASSENCFCRSSRLYGFSSP